MRMKNTKSFLLTSGNEEGARWWLNCTVDKLSRFKGDGKGTSFNFQTAEYLKRHNNQYNQDHSEQIAEYNEQWNREHKGQIAEYNKQWNEEHGEQRIQLSKQWREANPEQNLRNRKKGIAKRKRELGYIEILPTVWGCVQHHVDDIHVIPIPAVVHQMFSGYPREEHRRLVDEWMREIRPDLWLIVHTRGPFEDVFREMIERCKQNING